jgi:hypothetical protein
VRAGGGRARSFPFLLALLRELRGRALPDNLVLERTPALERHQGQLGRLQGRAVPAILLLGSQRMPAQGDGSPSTSAPGRLIPLDKPFPGQNFLQCLLALLHDGNAVRTAEPPPATL